MKAILVTGRNGFVGGALVEQLKKKHKVISLIRKRKEGITYSGEKLILSDIQALKLEDLRQHHIDLIIHLAAAVRGGAKYLLENNVKISEKIFQLADMLKVPVIHLSSTNVLFSDCLGSYSSSKKICEEIIKEKGINFLIIRTPLIVGSGSSSTKAVKDFYKKFSFFPLFGKQEGKVQPIHISSLVEFILVNIDRSIYSREVLTLIGSNIYTFKDILRGILNQYPNPRFIRIPYSLSRLVVRIFECANFSFFVSTEELASVNMDKVVENDGSGRVKCVNNDGQLLFS